MTIVLVALLGILCLILIYEAAIYEPPPPYFHTSINFASPVITNRTIDDEVRWDAMMEINKVTPKDELHSWSRIHITIEGSDGKVLNRGLELKKYDESKLDDGSDGIIEVQAWYIDDPEQPNKLSYDDQIIITGMTRTYEGCVIKVIIPDNFVAPSIVFPNDFE